MADLVLQASGLVKQFRRRGRGGRAGTVRAVDGVDLAVARGQTTAVVGESGSGKSTMARLIVGLTRPDAGEVIVGGHDLWALRGRALRKARRSVQLVFQDPHASLDPRMSSRASVAEPWQVNHMFTADERAQRADELLVRVGLATDRGDRYPHQLSGGEAQRVAIARALALEPEVVVLDEPVSALDVSVQAQVLELLRDLQDRLALTYLFISHDLAVVDQIADRVAVMYAGRIVETGARESVLAEPSHPYTCALVSAAPLPDPIAQRSHGRILLREPAADEAVTSGGCRFRPRCWKAEDRCGSDDPMLTPLNDHHLVACHFPERSEREAQVSPG